MYEVREKIKIDFEVKNIGEEKIFFLAYVSAHKTPDYDFYRLFSKNKDIINKCAFVRRRGASVPIIVILKPMESYSGYFSSSEWEELKHIITTGENTIWVTYDSLAWETKEDAWKGTLTSNTITIEVVEKEIVELHPAKTELIPKELFK